MNLKEILTELRSNPKQNLQKMAGHQEAIQFLKSKGCTWYHDNGYAVSMTREPKLGINPTSPYNTPLGIYFYDAAHYLERKEDNDELNYQDGAAYIQIFKYRDDAEIITIDEVDVDEYNRYIKMLFSSTEIPTILGISQKQVTDVLSKALLKAGQESLIKSYGGYLWYVLMALSHAREIGSRQNAGVASRSAVIWNRLIRILRIDVIVDHGSGIIHENEPNQGVVLNPRAIELIKTIKNINPATSRLTPRNGAHAISKKDTIKGNHQFYNVTFKYYDTKNHGIPTVNKCLVTAEDKQHAINKVLDVYDIDQSHLISAMASEKQ